MRSLGVTDLLVLVMFVVLVLDSRRLRSLARAPGRSGRDVTMEAGMPAGSDPDLVGITLRQIQLRRYVDSEDGGVGWDGPEILPLDEDDEDEVEDEESLEEILVALDAQFDDLPAPRHHRPTVALHWITGDINRRPAKMLECSASSSGTSTAP
jgi:hypothetical protein